MNRLRAHYVAQQEQKPQRRLQREIVETYRADIINLISDDGATLPEVADAVRAQGEPVLDAGFKAAILKTIGTVKNIRAGRISITASQGAVAASSSLPTAASTPLLPPNNSASTPLEDDDDDAFAVRRPPR